MKKNHLILLCTLALSACYDQQQKPASPPYTGPEALLRTTVKTISLPIVDSSSARVIVGAAKGGTVVLRCEPKHAACGKVENALRGAAIVTQREVAAEGINVAFITASSLAVTDCDPKYIDNSHNTNNYNHPNFGCAQASNMAHMISDKRQITDPTQLDPMDGQKAAAAYQKYQLPPSETASQDSKMSSTLKDNASTGK